MSYEWIRDKPLTKFRNLFKKPAYLLVHPKKKFFKVQPFVLPLAWAQHFGFGKSKGCLTSFTAFENDSGLEDALQFKSNWNGFQVWLFFSACAFGLVDRFFVFIKTSSIWFDLQWFLVYFVHIFCTVDKYSHKLFAYFMHIFYIQLHILCKYMHISSWSILASRVVACSCTIPASPTTRGSCTLFIARKLMRIRLGMATPGRHPDRPAARAGPPSGTPHSRRPSASAAAKFLLLLLQDKVAILAQYTSICNICNKC